MSQPGLNESPFDRREVSVTTEGDYFTHADVDEKRVRVGDKFWDTKQQFTLEVVDIVETVRVDKRGRETGRGPVKVVCEVDHPEYNNIRIPDEKFTDELAEDRLIPHQVNGWLPRELRM